ncbi:MAG: dimethylsulfoniopropionate demethylase [Gammaproteobacteria bacterium]
MPNPVTAFGPRVRKSPFFEATRRYGCNAFSVFNHMYMPIYYDGPEVEFWRLVNDVSIWDVACERQVEITGPDAFQLTQMLTPRNLSRCQVGQCKYVVITGENGGVLNDPVLLRLGENHFWLSLADSDILLWARGVALNSGLDVTIREPDVSPLQVQGPKSTAVMEKIFGDWVNELRYYWFRETELNGMPLVISRTGWSSEKGFEIFLRDGTRGDELWEVIMAAGRPHQIGPVAPNQIRRIEGAMISYGADATAKDNPYELGLDRLVDLDQTADFIGKAALRKIKTEGVKRRLAGIEIDGKPMPQNEEWWPLLRGEQQIGELRSGIYSPRLNKNIGMAMLAIEHVELGTQLALETPAGGRSAQVVPMPFYDPGKNIVSE